MFIGPAGDYSLESWQVYWYWDIQRKDDGTVMAVHPHRDYWLRQNAGQYRSQVEMTLPSFKQAVTTAHQARVSEYSGRIDDEADLPMLVTAVDMLHQHHVDTGNVTHPDGPLALPPPPCGKAVPDQADNPGLMQDCMTLLALKDALRGTGTLNWGVDTRITRWDGVTVAGTPMRVTKLELANKSLTGCIPLALRDVAVNDLDDLGLPDCVG